MALSPCPLCARHVRDVDARCPFCGSTSAVLLRTGGRAAVVLGAGALALACQSGANEAVPTTRTAHDAAPLATTTAKPPPPQPDTIAVPAYGVPPPLPIPTPSTPPKRPPG